jgi:quercetin dioxygenase-like cupin family protein/alkylhydroperoxidase/carboxymuconolactone decarboxylase family protein YurZ
MNKVTDGRNYLGDIAPKFAELNDDILFGEVWSRETQLSPRDRSMITVSALMASGLFDDSLKGHLKRALGNGVTRQELVELVTHLAFYTGWPKAWSVFFLMKEIFTEQNSADPVNTLFGKGDPNPPEYARYFTGKTYVNMLIEPTETSKCLAANVTFEPGCRNNWHNHPTGQILFVTNGRGWYQEWGRQARELRPGDVVNIPCDVKHWHGAAKDSWFVHLAVEPDARPGAWFDPVSDTEYDLLP